jgi:SpoVK/Ycf46/Vps4 family AAA+-type ATPase
MAQTRNPISIAWFPPAPTAYGSPLQHLEDHLGRISDLIAAHLARAPERAGRRRGLDRNELVARAALRGADDVPEEAEALWSLADAKGTWIAEREELTAAAGVELPLVRLVRAFGLGAAERDALLLAAAPRVDARFVAEWEECESNVVRPDVRFVLAVLGRTFEGCAALRRMFAIDAPLVASSLILSGGSCRGREGDFLDLDLDVPRRVINQLLGDASLDEELVSFSCVRAPLATLDRVVLPAETKELVRSIVEHHAAWHEKRRAWGIDDVVTYGRGLVLLFSGPPGTGKTMLAHAVAGALGKRLFVVDAGKLAAGNHSLESTIDAVFREAKLLDALLFFDEAEQVFASRRVGNVAMPTLLTRLETFDGIAVLATNMEEVLDEALHRRVVASVRFSPPAPAARAEIWRKHLPAALPLAEDVDLERLSVEFDLTGGLIKNAVLTGVLRAVSRDADRVSMDDLEHGARLQIRIDDDGTGTLVRPEIGLDDVVIAPARREQLERFVAAARVRATVLFDWGFGRAIGRGLTHAALLSGPTGTGKSMTAEAIARALDRPLLRARVAGLLSKYVGETGKRLEAAFERARDSRAVLLFDEADALFARRVSVRSSIDRYANAETAVLLDSLERHDGVVVLTTNLVEEIDPAFGRRLQLRLSYDRPDANARAAIWRRMLPSEAPVSGDVDVQRLARAFDLSGGQIRNAVLAAALEAASEQTATRRIAQATLERAARLQLGAEPSVEAHPAVGLA